MAVIDLNADLGEGFGVWTLGDDLALLDLISSANVACGFHAGDPSIMRRVCAEAAKRGVRIGAQVSYRDLAGFGRREMDMAPAELAADVLYQIGALSAFGEISYVKPHGALYNRVVWDEKQAAAVVDAIASYDSNMPIVGLPDSVLLGLAAKAGLETVPEGFCDRAYTADGKLAPRSQPGAVITDAEEAARRAVKMAQGGRLRTLCVHGDTPGAVAMARRVRAALEKAGLQVEAFT